REPSDALPDTEASRSRPLQGCEGLRTEGCLDPEEKIDAPLRDSHARLGEVIGEVERLPLRREVAGVFLRFYAFCLLTLADRRHGWVLRKARQCLLGGRDFLDFEPSCPYLDAEPRCEHRALHLLARDQEAVGRLEICHLDGSGREALHARVPSGDAWHS